MPLDLNPDDDFRTNALTLVHLAKAAYSDDPESDASFRKTAFESAATFSNKRTQTFGFVAANDANLVVAFRGTDSLGDWLTNLRFGMRKQDGVFVHDGFANAVDSVWDRVHGLIESKGGASKAIWVTGHSLGGALATWTAYWLRGGLTPVAAMTFGQPRVGDLKFSEKYAVEHHRFVNNRDIVPTVPPRLTPGTLFPPTFYTHVDTLRFFDEDGVLIERPKGILGVAAELADALGPLASGEEEARQLIADGIADHRIDRYIECVAANQP